MISKYTVCNGQWAVILGLFSLETTMDLNRGAETRKQGRIEAR